MVDRIKKAAPGEADIAPEKAPEIAGLDALHSEALAAENVSQAANDAAVEKADKKAVDTMTDDLADVLAMVATVAKPGMWWLEADEFERLWGKPVQTGIAANGAEIMRRHGLTMGDVMHQWGPYIGLAMAIGPSALATVQTYKRKTAELARGPKNDAAS